MLDIIEFRRPLRTGDTCTKIFNPKSCCCCKICEFGTLVVNVNLNQNFVFAGESLNLNGVFDNAEGKS